jgi:hypothetical protein
MLQTMFGMDTGRSCAIAQGLTDEAMEEGTVDLPQLVVWEGCMSEEVCCLAHDEITDHHQVQRQR